MSHIDHTTYFINAFSKSSSSVDVANGQLENVSVTTAPFQTIAVYGKLEENDKKILDKHFEISDNIFDDYELSLLEE